MSDKSKWVTGKPVPKFPIDFKWQSGDWERLFNCQVELLRQDIQRARAEDKVIVYLSCPISSRGGGYRITNVDIAKATQAHMMSIWGDRFWILNPSQYQMESKEGTGLMQMHADREGIDLSSLGRASGGDYMRMWTKVLVEDPKLKPTESDDDPWAEAFDAFYFIGPNDVNRYFTRGGANTLTAGIEEYFSRKYTMDRDFQQHFAWPEDDVVSGSDDQDKEKRSSEEAQSMRNNFFRFYGIRASTNFSLGAHDEWNIFKHINDKRMEKFIHSSSGNGNTGELLTGYFDGNQVDLGSAVNLINKGYEQ